MANLHGLPSVLGGLISILLVNVFHSSSNDFFLHDSVGTECTVQLLAIVGTLIVSIVTGYPVVKET